MESQEDLATVVERWASIKLVVFKTVLGVFFGLALVSVLARVAVRLYLRRRLSVDDYLLFAAALFLSGSTGVMYDMSRDLYLWMALRKDPSLVTRLDPRELSQILETAIGRTHAFFVITWTAIFLVKASFLAFFKQLIWQTDMIQRYYWAVVVMNLVSWMFLIVEPFILCHDFGMESVKCLEPSKNMLYIALTGLITALDALTDILIVSIPVILLSRSSMRLSQKVALGTFMCLSLVMVCIAIVRCSHIYYGKQGIDLPWEFFWQCMEENIAVLMGALTVFRTLLTHESKKRANERQRVRAAGPRSDIKSPLSFRMWRYLKVKERLTHSDLESQDATRGLPDIPSATITGLRTFIRGNNCDGGQSLRTSDTLTRTSQNDALADNEATIMYPEGKPFVCTGDDLKRSKLDSTRHIWGSQEVSLGQ